MVPVNLRSFVITCIVVGDVAMILPSSTRAQFAQSAKCGVFYDKWNVPGAPAETLATVGMAHEMFAAQDCIRQKNTAVACEHYRRALVGLEKASPALSAAHGAEIKAKMAEINCQESSQ